MRTPAYLAALLAFMLTGVAVGNDIVERQHRFDRSGIERLIIEQGVGSIRLEPADGDDVEVELRIEPQRNGGWFRRTPDVSNMDLQSGKRGDVLTLAFKERNVASHWVVRLPALTELVIDAGVGQVAGRLPSMTARINLGVGEVDIGVERNAVGAVDLSVGVGETRITGAVEEKQQRAFVSSQSSGRGDGANALWIKVGVGEVRVDLR
jgi:hypothetical protein